MNARGTTNAGGLKDRENFGAPGLLLQGEKSAPGSTLSQIPSGTSKPPPAVDMVGNPLELVLLSDRKAHSPFPGCQLKEFRGAVESPTLGQSQREGRRHQGFRHYIHSHPASASIPHPLSLLNTKCSRPLTLQFCWARTRLPCDLGSSWASPRTPSPKESWGRRSLSRPRCLGSVP